MAAKISQLSTPFPRVVGEKNEFYCSSAGCVAQVTNDIALLKLARDVEFIPQVLEPVCLPLAFDKYDVAKKGRASTAPLQAHTNTHI
jgi:hypothetical protein